MILWKYLKSRMLNHLTQVVEENGAQMSFEALLIWAEHFSKKLMYKITRAGREWGLYKNRYLWYNAAVIIDRGMVKCSVILMRQDTEITKILMK